MKKNESGQSVSFMMLDIEGNIVESGWAGVYVTLDNGTQFQGSGTTAHKGQGEWTYGPIINETNAFHAAYTMHVSGAIRQTLNTFPQPFTNNFLDINMFSISGDPNSAYNLKNMYNGIGYTHDTAPSSRSQVFDISGQTIEIGNDTNYISGQVDTIYDEFDNIPSGIFTHDYTDYTTSGTLGGFLYRSNNIDGLSLQESLRIIGAICAGKISGAQTSTEVFKGLDGTTTRVTVSPDVSGNRIDVIYG